MGLLALFALLPALAFASPRDAASSSAPTTQQLQAALLMTFARFTEWVPGAFESTVSPLVIGFIADESAAEAFEAAARGKNVGGRPLVVKRLQWDSDVQGVHMLFIGDDERRRAAIIVERVQRRPILTVSPLPDFAQAGGIIALKSSGGRLSFSVNGRATSLSGVRLSSFLLSHATEVIGASGPGAK
jgi:hypothetical protein